VADEGTESLIHLLKEQVMDINTNVSAMQAAANLNKTQNAIASSTEKLSSGFRINSAADDAAGLGIANKLDSDVGAYQQASRNASQANSIYNIAEGAATSIQGMLSQMKQLAAEAASDTVDSNGRTAINQEYTALSAEIDRTVATTTFQGQTLLNGSFGATVDSASTALSVATAGVYDVQLTGAQLGSYTIAEAAGKAVMNNGSTDSTGATIYQTLAVTSGANQTLNFSQFGITVDTNSSVGATTLNGTNITVGGGSGTFLVGASGQYTTNDTLSIAGSSFDLGTSSLGIGGTSVDTLANAQTALASLDTAITAVNATLGTIGAGQNRLTNAISNLGTTVQNYQAAEGTIKDVDMATEMVSFSTNQILAQAGTAMLAQANQAGSSVLKLLQ
jgi:flagellin